MNDRLTLTHFSLMPEGGVDSPERDHAGLFDESEEVEHGALDLGRGSSDVDERVEENQPEGGAEGDVVQAVAGALPDVVGEGRPQADGVRTAHDLWRRAASHHSCQCKSYHVRSKVKMQSHIQGKIAR